MVRESGVGVQKRGSQSVSQYSLSLWPLQAADHESAIVARRPNTETLPSHLLPSLGRLTSVLPGSSLLLFMFSGHSKKGCMYFWTVWLQRKQQVYRSVIAVRTLLETESWRAHHPPR